MKKKNTPSLSALDRFIGYFSPSTLNQRMIARQSAAVLTRQYDAAQSFNASPIKRNTKSANKELTGQLAPIRENVRDLIRNAPFAQKGLSAIVNGVVGWGFEAKITHADAKKLDRIQSLWLEWSSGACSIDGKTDFYNLQSQVLTAVVADGECVIREVAEAGSIRLHIMEADYVNDRANDIASKNGDFRTINGVTVDRYNRPSHYHLFKLHPGEAHSETEAVAANEVIHVFRQDRPGQVRGVSWFAPVAHPLKMLSELQWTQLVRLKLSAAITGVVTQEPSSLGFEQLQAQREEEFDLSPGTFKFLNPGESIEFPSIPNPEGFDGTAKLTLREIASGLGITYELLSGDLSQTNFSSARMGDLQFRANVDSWRWHLMVPRFLNPAFDRFKKFCALKGVDASACTVEWTPPARAMISPVDEVNATKSAIRAGLQTLPGAIRELGLDPEKHLKEIAESNALLDKLGLVLDSDPRLSGNGQLNSPEAIKAVTGEGEDTPE